MQVAFTTSSGAVVDGNFKAADNFSIWDVNQDEAYYVTTLWVKEQGKSAEDRIALRAEMLKGCAIVCAAKISGPSVARLVAQNIHPLRVSEPTPIEDIIDRLQMVLRGTPAPWLRKAAMQLS